MTRRPFSSPFARLAAAALALLLFALLSGCWAAEHYVARIKIERDGSYKLTMEGTAAHPETIRALRRLDAEIKSGKLKGDDLKKRQIEALAPLQKALDALKDDKRVQNLSSLGDGRVRFSLSSGWSMDRKMLIFTETQAPLAYAVGQDGTMRVRVKDAVASAELPPLGLATEGDLSVVLAEGIEVLEHNAQKAPTSALGAYRWHIGGGSAVPYLKLRLPAVPAHEQGLAAKEGAKETGKEAHKAGHGAPAQKGLAHQ